MGMKAFVFSAIMILALSVNAQEHITPIEIEDPWIFKFGESPVSVMSKINDLFSDKTVNYDGKSVTIYGIKFGGISYNYAEIEFYDNKYLWSVLFTRVYELTELKEMCDLYDQLTNRIKAKYFEPSIMKEEGVEVAKYWEDGRGMFLMVTYEKAKSVGGDQKYYLMVNYYNSAGLNDKKKIPLLDEVM